MEASEFANSVKASYSTLHPIECDPKRNVLGKMFVLPGITNVNQINTPGSTTFADPRFDTLGQTYIATQGAESGTIASTLGEIWVTYKVRLSRPILETGASSTGLIQTFQMVIDSTGNANAPANTGKECVVRTKGGVGFSYMTYTPGTTAGSVRLGFNGNTRGYFFIHVTGRVRYGVASSWYGHTTNTIATPYAQWSYDNSLLYTLANPGYTVPADYRLAGYADLNNGTNYRAMTGSHVGYFLPSTLWPNYMDVPLFTNGASQSVYQITIVGIPDPTMSLSRVRDLMWKNLSENQSRGLLESSDYLKTNTDSSSSSSSSTDDLERHHGCQDGGDDDEDDVEETEEETSTPYETVNATLDLSKVSKKEEHKKKSNKN
jgi:hypothetical protein